MDDWIKAGTQKEVYGAEDVVNRNCPLCEQNTFKQIHQERGR